MKHNRNHDNAKSFGPPLQTVHFEFNHPAARTVCVAGTFNNWRPDAKPMHSLGGGHWVKETALAPGDYEYCLVVDGTWMPDPLAKETVPNPFGGVNSVLKVASPAQDSPPRQT
jgi:1,4-alpha-glucan branching enzyme